MYNFVKSVGNHLPAEVLRILSHQVVDLVAVDFPCRLVFVAEGRVERLLDQEKHVLDF